MRCVTGSTFDEISRAGNILFQKPFIVTTVFLLFLLPAQSVFATSGIARSVSSFCAPNPTVPDVNSCSACHSTTNNRGPNDLTTAGMWSLNQATFSNFCPTATPAPTPGTGGTGNTGGGTGTGTGGNTGTGMGMGTRSGMRSGMRGMGSRSGRSRDDDDDDGGSRDDDDDDDDD